MNCRFLILEHARGHAAGDGAFEIYVATIGAATGLKGDFGSGLWKGGPIGIPFDAVPLTQMKYGARFLYAGEGDPGPYAAPLHEPSASTGDRQAIAVDKGNCVLYEPYRAFPQSSVWKADSGAIFDLRSNALRPAAGSRRSRFS